MLRVVYILLLDLHPSHFRQRFGAEMLAIFEDADGLSRPILLIGDGLLSLLRQWIFRSEFRRPLATPLVHHLAESAPPFRTLDEYPPPRSVLLGAVGLAALTFGLLATLISYGGRAQRFLVGAHYPRPALFQVARSSFEAADLNAAVKVGPAPEDPLKGIAAVYFKVIRVLNVLDADRDLIISPWEIFTAPAALRKLDLNDDGKLSPEELGFSMGSKTMPEDVVKRARLTFIRENPVLAALDTNHDGQVSADELASSSRTLKTLDQNGDGSLTPGELIPDQQIARAAMLFIKLDANGDGLISREERDSQEESALRALLQTADRNHDGYVTEKEWKDELRLTAEQKRQLESARRAAGFR